MAGRPELIDLDVAREYAEEARAQFVDARPGQVYEHSRERIPGAIHVEPGTGAALTEALRALPRERLIIAYCDEPGQAASAQVARRVRELGIGDGCVLAGGFRAWQQAGFPTEVVTPPLASPARKPATCSYLVERTARSVKVEVWASSLPELFTQASLGLADALGVPRLPVEPTEHLFTLRARDSHALLLLWLTELIGRVADERRLFVEIAIEQLTERELRARARGAEVAEWRLEPRADLLPELTMERGQQGIDLVMTLPTH